jgi:hypothetical protein
MKTMKALLTGAYLFLCSLSLASAQSTAFTYNGRLNNNGAPVNGPYEMQFTLYDSEADGVVVSGPLAMSPVNVANGLFTLRLDFGAGVFTGPARWLEIAVRPAGGDAFMTLAPRQEVTSSPYAIRAQTAASLANSSVDVTQLNTGGMAPVPGQLLSFNGGSLAWTDPGVAAGGIWSVQNNNAYYSQGNVGVGGMASGTSKLQITGADALTLSGAGPYLTWNDTTTGRNAAISSAAGTLYYRVPNAAGSVVTAGYVDSNGMVTRGRLSVEGSGPYITWADNASGRSATISSANGTLYYRVPDAAGNVLTAGYVDSNGMVTRGRLSVEGKITITDTLSAARGIVIGNNPGTSDAPILSNNAASTRVVFYNAASGSLMDVACRNGDVATLSVRGGADLAEPFELSGTDIAKGSVVVIDPENEGKLKLSEHAYDRRVAGVVSGAKGVKPGISLRQEGLLSGGQNVALTGRVYVLAEADDGAIRPGDLLTTSDTPGHAMKVADPAKAHGAILGKAMSGLTEGKGLVLVLVTLE